MGTHRKTRQHCHTQSHHPSDAPALGTDDRDRAVFLNAFVAVASALPAGPGMTRGVFEFPVPGEKAAHRGIEGAHSHDPPFLTSLSSRAPPAFLS